MLSALSSAFCTRPVFLLTEKSEKKCLKFPAGVVCKISSWIPLNALAPVSGVIDKVSGGILVSCGRFCAATLNVKQKQSGCNESQRYFCGIWVFKLGVSWSCAFSRWRCECSMQMRRLSNERAYYKIIKNHGKKNKCDSRLATIRVCACEYVCAECGVRALVCVLSCTSGAANAVHVKSTAIKVSPSALPLAHRVIWVQHPKKGIKRAKQQRLWQRQCRKTLQKRANEIKQLAVEIVVSHLIVLIVFLWYLFFLPCVSL